MSVANQLYQLQEVDLELESNEQAVKQITRQLGDNEAVVKAQEELASERVELEKLTHQQHSVEWEVEDITGKFTTVEEQLYSGRVRNPKELTDLQHETEILKTNRAKLEEKALEAMEQVETATETVSELDRALKKQETEWQSNQGRLSADLERHKGLITDLEQKRQLITADIDAPTIELYQGVKKQRGTAVAKVEQGICIGCRISLSVSEFQRARTGNLVRCSSCGRILFVA
ncbi:MAG: C4-type zinc ribbon domain-containing protein [Dehalococcoidales bacterium]|jgi:hypothetical protein|nr:C4-type zinc ribbon domain-containing protein [Dehalococcoidales bacterium]